MAGAACVVEGHREVGATACWPGPGLSHRHDSWAPLKTSVLLGLWLDLENRAQMSQGLESDGLCPGMEA